MVGVAGVGADVVGVACGEGVEGVLRLATSGYHKKAKAGRGPD